MSKRSGRSKSPKKAPAKKKKAPAKKKVAASPKRDRPIRVVNKGRMSAARGQLVRLLGTNDKYVRYGVQGKGNCFYHAVLATETDEILQAQGYRGLTAVQQRTRAKEFRQALRGALDNRKYVQRIEPFLAGDMTLEQLKQDVAKDRCWVENELVVKLVEIVYGVDIVIYDLQGNRPRYVPERLREAGRNSRRPVILLAWVEGNHFEPIFEMSGDGKIEKTTFRRNDVVVQRTIGGRQLPEEAEPDEPDEPDEASGDSYQPQVRARRGRRAQRDQGCVIQQRWPALNESVRELKYIGRHLQGQFRAENITTLQTLVDTVQRQSLAQNRRMFQRVFVNPRAEQCVDRTTRSPDRNLHNVWPDPPHRVPNRPAGGLPAGDYTFCVNQYNKCGWMTVEAFLRHQSQTNQRPTAAKIPAYPDRVEYCEDDNWCLQRGVLPQGSPPQADDDFFGDDEGNYSEDVPQPPPTRSSYSTGAKILGRMETKAAADKRRAEEQRKQRESLKKAPQHPASRANKTKRTETQRTQTFLKAMAPAAKRKRGGSGSKSRTTTVRYYIAENSGDDEFAKAVHDTLSNRKMGIVAVAASSGKPVRYREVKSRRNADIIVSLVPQSQIVAKCGMSELSCTTIYHDRSIPEEILISLENWNGGSDYRGKLSDYRIYIINHEFLHARPFYLDHPTALACLEEGGKLPVMYQQSRGSPDEEKCEYNSWPMKKEIMAAAFQV